MADRPIADPELEAYALRHSTAPSADLVSVADSTRAFSSAHGMMVGGLEGRLLAFLVAVSRARRILEVGTFTGYSAISMAEALPPDGHVTTLEVSPDHAARAAEHIASSGVAGRVSVIVGPAIDSLARLEGPFDLVFIDADKGGYAAYYEGALRLLAPAGIIVVDNVLWSGRVLDDGTADPDSAAMRAFNDMVVSDSRVDCVILTVRDGVTLIRRRDGQP